MYRIILILNAKILIFDLPTDFQSTKEFFFEETKNKLTGIVPNLSDILSEHKILLANNWCFQIWDISDNISKKGYFLYIL